jgi:hypothetical protein
MHGKHAGDTEGSVRSRGEYKNCKRPAMNYVRKTRRKLRNRFGSLTRFSSAGSLRRVLFLTERDEIAVAQTAPFFVHSRLLRERDNLEVRQLPLREFLRGSTRFRVAVEAVCVQTWFNLTERELRDLFAQVRSAWPEAAIAYLDWFAPTDLRYAAVLDPYISVYVKKQVLANFSAYGKATIGDTVLTDFYARRFGLEMPIRRFPVPAGFERKLILGPGFECSPLVAESLRWPVKFRDRPIDLHARFTTAGTDWYTQMREECLAEAMALASQFRVASHGRVTRREFRTELGEAKLCFSPFGYGPLCWRDFEAMSAGALLLKQDVGYLRLARKFFVPYETYVPLRWDLSDLREKVDYYVHHSSEREAIARNAHEVLREYVEKKLFLQDVAPLWRLLGFESAMGVLQAARA